MNTKIVSTCSSDCRSCSCRSRKMWAVCSAPSVQLYNIRAWNSSDCIFVQDMQAMFDNVILHMMLVQFLSARIFTDWAVLRIFANRINYHFLDKPLFWTSNIIYNCFIPSRSSTTMFWVMKVNANIGWWGSRQQQQPAHQDRWFSNNVLSSYFLWCKPRYYLESRFSR